MKKLFIFIFVALPILFIFQGYLRIPNTLQMLPEQIVQNLSFSSGIASIVSLFMTIYVMYKIKDIQNHFIGRQIIPKTLNVIHKKNDALTILLSIDGEINELAIKKIIGENKESFKSIMNMMSKKSKKDIKKLISQIDQIKKINAQKKHYSDILINSCTLIVTLRSEVEIKNMEKA
ncbi:TPA: hypothetical protein I8571_000251 [Citrobacter freundii]|uniref:hypothetical protein n=1 Tax=Citrobacter braakii TaxID=57706 RepID=UPI001A32983A|nr:hypothetical protein [Citrobacter freundii]HEF0122926.1 hypothetical protein [Citrobacter youngae]